MWLTQGLIYIKVSHFAIFLKKVSFLRMYSKLTKSANMTIKMISFRIKKRRTLWWIKIFKWHRKKVLKEIQAKIPGKKTCTNSIYSYRYLSVKKSNKIKTEGYFIALGHDLGLFQIFLIPFATHRSVGKIIYFSYFCRILLWYYPRDTLLYFLEDSSSISALIFQHRILPRCCQAGIRNQNCRKSIRRIKNSHRPHLTSSQLCREGFLLLPFNE